MDLGHELWGSAKRFATVWIMKQMNHWNIHAVSTKGAVTLTRIEKEIMIESIKNVYIASLSLTC